MSNRSEVPKIASAINLLTKNDQEEIQLSELAELTLSLKANVQAEIVHYLLYTNWQASQPDKNSFLWSYRAIVDNYWERQSLNVVDTANVIAEEINNQTQEIFRG
ncbi:MAG: hypothetical protein H6633_12735 [Anaerolineales bacterium]|nr:hypothetical protein [Anaerolineales bacterium]